MASLATITITMGDDAAKVLEVMDGMFDLMNDMEELIPEWNTFELKRLQERRHALAEQAAALIGTD